MNVLRLVLVAFLLVLVVGTFLVSKLTKSEWSVERSVLVHAEPAAVAEFAAELKNWPKFLPGDVGGEKVEYLFGAETRGAGASLTIKSAAGEASLHVTRFEPERGLDYDVRFPGGGETIANTLGWQREGAETRVTLRESSAIGWNPIPRLLRGVIEDAIGKDVQHVVERLKAAVEAGSAPPPGSAPPAAAPRGHG